jgi:hypothetical protein
VIHITVTDLTVTLNFRVAIIADFFLRAALKAVKVSGAMSIIAKPLFSQSMDG